MLRSCCTPPWNGPALGAVLTTPRKARTGRGSHDAAQSPRWARFSRPRAKPALGAVLTTSRKARTGRGSHDAVQSPRWARFSRRRAKPALGAVLTTPPKCLTDRSPSFGASSASTNTSETCVCDERGRPVGRASRRGRETRAERRAVGASSPRRCLLPPERNRARAGAERARINRDPRWRVGLVWSTYVRCAIAGELSGVSDD
jgi:hypothetical protein